MKPIKDIERIDGFFLMTFKLGWPHITANKAQ